MIKIQLLWMFVLSSLLAGCGETNYGPAGSMGGIDYGGYSDTRTSANTAIVRFSGNSSTPLGKVQSNMLYRCAQVTLANGYDYFIVESTTTSPLNVNVQTQSTNSHYQSSPPKLHDTYYRNTHFRSYSTSYTQTPVAIQDLHATSAVIKMFSGNMPGGVPNAFNARDVIAHYGPATF